MVFECPLAAATSNAVAPCSVGWLTSAPDTSKSVTVRGLPSTAAIQIGGMPVLLRLGLAPLRRSKAVSSASPFLRAVPSGVAPWSSTPLMSTTARDEVFDQAMRCPIGYRAGECDLWRRVSRAHCKKMIDHFPMPRVHSKVDCGVHVFRSGACAGNETHRL